LYSDETVAESGQHGKESRARAYLQRFLQEHAESLQTILCGYVAKMGLATGEHIETVAAEVFQDAALETLAHADRFNPEMQPRAWFLAIAANILKRHRTSSARRYRFEVVVSKLVQQTEHGNTQDLLDQLMAATASTPGPEQGVIPREAVYELLSLVGPEDAQLLNLALLQNWDASSLAAMMGTSPGNARVRVHRALSRLRAAWRASEERKEREKRNG
jgi:RNA polymerase sigma-70 factor (ECF subfamily)